MGRIQRLPDDVVNQIKAGEVVDRPASVVKELVENALDAGATRVEIELVDGGKQLIRVTDNGSGMAEGDLRLCLERHATSKIARFDDLESLHSFGFRGEALPSIAAVSQFSIASRLIDSPVGSEFSPWESDAIKPKAMPVGTSVTVRELFARVPVRLKFLKSTATEFAHISEYLKAQALVAPEVEFRLVHNGRESFRFAKANSFRERFRDFVTGGAAAAERFVFLDSAHGSFRVTGFLEDPAQAQSAPEFFLTYVNGRVVRDRVVRSGVLQGYEGLLLKGLSPAAVVFVDANPAWVDVNAHPSKTEVRFTDTLTVQDLLARAVGDSLRGALHGRMPFHSARPTPPSEPPSLGPQNVENSVENPWKTPKTTPSTTHSHTSFSGSLSDRRKTNTSTSPFWGKSQNLDPDPVAYAASEEAPPKAPDAKSPHEGARLKPPVKESLVTDHPEAERQILHYCGQFADTFLLFENRVASGRELWVVDQHAFHERILYEELMERHTKNLSIMRQSLLIPLLIGVPSSVIDFLEEQKKTLDILGFECEIMKKTNQVALLSAPQLIPVSEAAALWDDILLRLLALHEFPHTETHPLLQRMGRTRASLSEEGWTAGAITPQSLFQHTLSTMACHSAVRAGDPLPADEVHRLLKKAGRVDFYAHCPHGRPVYRRFEQKDVAQWFLRT